MNFDSPEGEICAACGNSVARGSAVFANRVPESNDIVTRIEMGRKYPHGEWICIICDNMNSDGEIESLEEVLLNINVANYFLKNQIAILGRKCL
jgi:hypothetical protein